MQAGGERAVRPVFLTLDDARRWPAGYRIIAVSALARRSAVRVRATTTLPRRASPASSPLSRHPHIERNTAVIHLG